MGDPHRSFLPRFLIERVLATRSLSPEQTAHVQDSACLFTDISGFTALAERLAADDAGVEKLTQLVNAHLAPLVDLILDHGGDVVKFAGDALLALWPAEGDLEEASARACACALAIQATMTEIRAASGEDLSLRASVAAGRVATALVGGVLGRREMIVAGDPISQLGVAGAEARPGDVVLAPETWRPLAARLSGHELPSGALRVDSIADPPEPRPLAPPPDPGDAGDALSPFIPAAIRGAVQSGHTDWLGQLRRLTVLFINLSGATHRTPVETAQAITRELQTVIYRFEGSVNKISVDDKGATMLAAFGLPPLAHADDPVRGVLAAMEAREALSALGLEGAIGVTTGRAFCCVVGSERRREYTVMGDVVNLSARLMQAAAEHGGVLCDETTARAASRRIRFQKPMALDIKGKSEPVPALRPVGITRAVTGGMKANDLVGRSSERALLERAIAETAGTSPNVRPIAFAGPPGIGKSRLLEHAVATAGEHGVRVLVGGGDPIEHSAPYHAWRPILNQALGVDEDDPGTRLDRALATLEGAPELIRLAPLLSDIIGIEVEDNELTATLEGEARADRTRELIAGIIRRLAELAPMLLILDDAQWMDSASWNTAIELRVFAPQILVILAHRPFEGEPPLELTELLSRGELQPIDLAPLSASDVYSLAASRLGGEVLDDALKRLFRDKAQGNPLYVEELARTLLESGAATVEGRLCGLAEGAVLDLPATLEGLVTSRIDRLGSDEQLAVKAASVIGRTFGLRALHEVYPMAAKRSGLAAVVASLVEAEITSPTDDPREPTHRFREGMVQDVAYKLLSHAQRRELHLAAAEAYERIYESELHAHYPLLAHHYSRAQVKQRAAEYLGRAGDVAFRGYANLEAVEFLSAALSEAQGCSTPLDPATRARWEHQLGDAHFALGHIGKSRAHLLEALRCLGQPVTESSARLVLWTLNNLLRNGLRRISPLGRKARDHEATARLLQLVRIYERLTQIHFFGQEYAAGIHASTSAVNLGEQAGPSAELARAYANACLMNSVMGLRRTADRFERLALETAPALTDAAYVNQVVGLHRAGQGRWTEARNALARAKEIAEDLEDHRRFDESTAALAVVVHHMGELEESRALYAEVYESGRRHGSAQARMWGFLGQARNLIPMGSVERGLEYVERARQLLEQRSDLHHDRLLSQEVFALQASGALAQGRRDAARQAARQTLGELRRSSPTAFYTAHVYSIPAEVLIALLRDDDGAEDREQLMAEARRALRTSRAFARIFRFGRVDYLRLRALFADVRGSKRKARKLLGASLTRATALELPREQDLAKRALERMDGKLLGGTAR
jgi:class 3 adenylate cyclase/tetratricopeptide (TPR) repeat protein